MERYILVTGGELFNKGAQAMTFVTVDEIAKRYPDKRVALISPRDFLRDEEQKKLYNIEFVPEVDKKIKLFSMILKHKPFIRLVKNENQKMFLRILNNTDVLLDISGYALGSNWGSGRATAYMLRVVMAWLNKIPVYLMPQSFGPFSFDGKKGKLADKLIKLFMPYVKVIMARENEGYNFLTEKYGCKNVVKTTDLVLQNKKVDTSNIFTQIPVLKDLDVKPQGVALIPNQKTTVYGDENTILDMYKHIIDHLLLEGKNIYLIYHAVEDLELCKKIKRMFYQTEDNVILCMDEYSCLEFDQIVKKFDFVIASRFHAIVHAYKNAIPAIVLGWAVKYKELMGAFEQEKYLFDVRSQFEIEKINKVVETMCRNSQKESKIINDFLVEIQKENVYDFIKL